MARTDLDRRNVLTGAGALALTAPAASWLTPAPASAAPLQASAAPFRLTAAPTRHTLTKKGTSAEVDAWGYNGSVPGPLLRFVRGDRLDITFVNDLPEPSAVHWHGLRPPNAMDGAAPLTQPPVPPGETFRYAFDLNDAGTYWYHTHFRAWNQQDRGLYGVLIVDETVPPAVDRDLTLVLDDWVITPDGQLSERFGNFHELSHAGRLGNLATVNNAVDPQIDVAAGERIRLRFVNVANAQIFAVVLEGHRPVVVAQDGNAVTPYRADAPLVIGPAQRIDVMVDAVGAPGARHPILARTLREEVRLATLSYARAPGGSGLVGTPVPQLEANARPTLDLAGAKRVPLRMEGGAMGGMRGAMVNGRMMGMRQMMREGKFWALNGIAGDMDEPLVRLGVGETVLVEMVNDTAFAHAMHLHGMHFIEISRDGRPAARRSWRDTTLLAPGERATIAFAGESPGRWMLHCHMVEHQSAGMMTFVEVEGERA